MNLKSFCGLAYLSALITALDENSQSRRKNKCTHWSCSAPLHLLFPCVQDRLTWFTEKKHQMFSPKYSLSQPIKPFTFSHYLQTKPQMVIICTQIKYTKYTAIGVTVNFLLDMKESCSNRVVVPVKSKTHTPQLPPPPHQKQDDACTHTAQLKIFRIHSVLFTKVSFFVV